ncbi:hypothetical protein [Gordonia sp. WA4-43]|nr:hypothetical protein [Gordonia sp. WA4-43]
MPLARAVVLSVWLEPVVGLSVPRAPWLRARRHVLAGAESHGPVVAGSQ